MAFVYALIDPRTDEVRYIGQTKYRQQRYKQHTQTTDKRNLIKQAWITELKEIGLLPTLVFLEEGVDWEQRFAREKYWINYYLSRGVGSPMALMLAPIVNRYPLPKRCPRKKRVLRIDLFARVQPIMGIAPGPLR